MLLSGAVADCRRSGSGGHDAGAPTVRLGSENVARVEIRTLQSGPAISGVLKARNEATVRAEVGGTVLQIFASQGDRVRKGQLLARLDATAIRDQLLAARSAVRSATDALEQAKRDDERSHYLAENGSIARRELERSGTLLAAAEAQEADARARLASAEQQLERTRPTAPFAGMVSERTVNAGDVVQPGAPVYTIIDPTTMRLEASVPAEHLSRLRTGTRVDFEVTGYPDRAFQGAIEQINPAVDPATGQVRIYVGIPNEGGTLLAGLFAKGRVVTVSRQAPAIPEDAVDAGTSPPTVMRVRDGQVERVPVELGLRDAVAEEVEIRAGLSPGDLVLLGSARGGVGPGTRVEVSQSTEKRQAQ